MIGFSRSMSTPSLVLSLLVLAPCLQVPLYGQTPSAQGPRQPASAKPPPVLGVEPPASKDGSAQSQLSGPGDQPSGRQVIELSQEARQQLAEIHSLLKTTYELVQKGSTVRGDFDDIQRSLHEIQGKVEPSLFQEVWHSYVSNVVWEFFGIKGESNAGPSIVGRIVSLLGLIIAGLKLRYWLGKNSSSQRPGEGFVNGLWVSYALVLALTFAALSWSGAVTNLNPEAVAFHESVVRASNQLQALQTLPSTLQSIDKRLGGLESRQTGPSILAGLLKAVLWLGAIFGCVVGGIYFYKSVLANLE